MTTTSPASLWLRVSAPFASYRPMQAGAYRTTLPTMPYSAAHGLVLNLAGIDTRDPTPAVTTLFRTDSPRLQLTIGSLVDPRRARPSTLFQQLHSYPVGSSGKEMKPRCHGSKYWIAPVRRELLVGLEVIIGVRCPQALCERVEAGLRGELVVERYGLPFAGDNAFLFDRIEVLAAPPAAFWYVPVDANAQLVEGVCRLPISIDRRNASRTRTLLCAPRRQDAPPEDAWVWTPDAQAGGL